MQTAQQQPQGSSAQVSKSREHDADLSRFISTSYCLSQDQPGTPEPQSSFPRRGISSQAQPGTASALQPHGTSPPSQQGLHPARLSTSCNGLSVSKNAPRASFLKFKPLLPATHLLFYFTSSPYSPRCSQTGFSGRLLYVQPTSSPSWSPQRGTAGRKPPSTTMLQSTTSLRFTRLSKYLFHCAIATKSPGRLQCLQHRWQVYLCCCRW